MESCTGKRNKIFISMLLLVALAVTFGCFYGVCCNIALAEENETKSVVSDGVSSLNTDIIIGRDLTIMDYPEQLHATEAAVRSRVRDENNPANFELYGLEKDDPICKLETYI